ncbi:M1 family metallopeptidase [Deinococcus sp.]|uniref:M1 family metallopeptidase n=1 Tax=Deinococcus sp. TaxID=47478 RepID=UPI003CC54962
MIRRRPLALLLALSLGTALGQAVPALPPGQALPSGFAPPRGAGDSIYPGLGDPGLDVTHYDLSLKTDPGSDQIEGRAVLSVTARSDLSQIGLDFAGPVASEVLLDEQPARFVQAGEKLLILPPQPLRAGTRFTLSVAYRGKPAAPLDPDLGIRLGWIATPGGSYTLSEPNAAHGYFPCDDLPADGASFTLHLDVPDGYTAVASGVQTGQRREGGRSVTDFELPQETATYALGIQIGKLELAPRPSAGAVLLRDAFPAALPAAVRAPFARTPEMLELLQSWFGPYPFAVYGVAVAPDPGFPPLETATLSTFPSRAEGETVALHELSHQWFGDSLRLGDWSDIWLNEGFATYAEALWAEHLGQDSAALIRRWDAALSHSPVRPLVAASASQLFDQTSYLRGALALHALRRSAGDEGFRAVLHAYVSRYAGHSARTQDFLEVVREVAGQRALEAIQPWVFSATLPPLPPPS